MVPLNDLPAAVRGALAEWLSVRWSDLRFREAPTALLVLGVLLALSILMLLARDLRSRGPGRRRMALPAILPAIRRSPLSAIRHGAFVVFVLGIPLFAVALADPRVSLVREEATRSGRRIVILIDGSGSMVLPFEAPKLAPQVNRTFFIAAAAAERFLKLRVDGANEDVLAVIQFGNEAYVITPFTTDHENVLLSLRLISQPRNWNRFNVFGTTIIQGIDQSLHLFKTFDLQGASGNLIVIFSDGNDGETMFRGRTLDDYVVDARQNRIPMYMVRLGYEKKLGDVVWDPLWKSVIEQTGGRFYAAPDENAIVRAVTEIDRLSAGRIGVRQYASVRPRFSGYALIAVALWLAAGVLKLGFRSFRTFP